jgi:hypothetical protein
MPATLKPNDEVPGPITKDPKTGKDTNNGTIQDISVKDGTATLIKPYIYLLKDEIDPNYTTK